MNDEPIPAEEISDFRSQRGLALARTQKDSIKTLIGTKYLVPSATSNGSRYVVDIGKTETCSCLDWSKLGGHDRPHRCKHLWAVIYVTKLADGSELIVSEKPPEPKKTYQRHNRWKTINACRTLIPHLAPHFCELLVDGLGLRWRVPGENGRPGVPLRDVLLVALIRAVENLTAGEAVVQAARYWKLGLITLTQLPSYNTLLRVFAQPEHMVLLHRLLAGSALPLIGLEDTFAVDGTGFGSSVYDHHFRQKHGGEDGKRVPTLRHRWLNAIIVFGVRTLAAVAAQVTDQHVGESPLMPELLRRVQANGGRVKEWLGDSAYLAWYNVLAVEEAGATPFYDWRDGVTGKTRPETIGRLYRRFNDDQDLYWEHYGKRSLAESGMNSIKTRFGHSLRSRVPHAQYAELMLRLVAHNIAMLITAVQEMNVDPRYWAADLIAKLPDFGSAQPPDQALERLGVKPSVKEEEE
jgi:hypothetical protein